ncbi:MAG: hypothetical protein HY782_13125 [Chloroflexi bacterium]|nr:hypothetical protein [Chloroflexota bacterium]
MQNKWLRYGLVIGGAVLALCIMFGAGIYVGRLSGRLGPGPVPWFLPFFSGGHGAVGRIAALEAQTIRLELRDGASQVILLDRDTRIDKNHQKLTLTDLKIGDSIVVIGSPTAEGQIKARWIRVLEPSTPALIPGRSMYLEDHSNPSSNGV